MTSNRNPRASHWSAIRCHPLLIMGLAASSVFYCLSPVLAEGTLAGTEIRNRATATYSDGTTNFEAISNTVTIKVEEVRGLTVTSAGFTDTNGGSIAKDDTVTFDFLVTNTGNSSAHIYLPGLTALQTMATGGTVTKVEVVAVNGAAIGPVEVAAAGSRTDTLTGIGAIAPDGNLRVRVTMQVTAQTAGNPITVQFGNTADNPGGTQNQQNIAANSTVEQNINDVRTIDADPSTPAVNGEREAAASHTEFLATAPRPLAQTTLLMTSSTAPGALPNDARDDSITYNLDFRVENNPQLGFPAGNLTGTTITLDGSQVERILVSTAVPPNTVWNGVPPTVPNGNWKVVYSTDDSYTGTENPLNIAWSTTTPTTPAEIAAVKRIGFVYDAAVSGSLPPGTLVSGFELTVITSGLPATGGTVANIGQIFGTTANDPAKNLVYDESGDQNPNNYNDGVFPANPEISNFITSPQTGAANPNDPDPGNNQGVGPGGESTVTTVTALPPTVGALLNGPNGVPNATGPNNNHDDFTNRATTVEGGAGLPGSPSNPVAVTITNTVRNTIATNLDLVTLLPYAPDAAKALVPSGDFGNNPIPDGTTVKIDFEGQSATYQYNSATGTFSLIAGNHVVINRLLPGEQKSYTITVDLPDGTAQVRGYAIPILAFVDGNGNRAFDSASETTYNFTVNRIYPGFIELVKESRILGADGTQIEGFTQTPAARPLPGQFVEYRITYRNVSEAQPASGGGNVILTGSNFVINEDGATLPNTWAAVTNHRQNTLATQGTLQFYNGATLLGSTDPANGVSVTRYVNTITSLVPQSNGTLTFRRIIK
jgi:hypothetical protein